MRSIADDGEGFVADTELIPRGTSPQRGEEKKNHPTASSPPAGGAAAVMKLVASSMAGPNGVGMVMRNGTKTACLR